MTHQNIIVRDSFLNSFDKKNDLFECFIHPIKTTPEIDASLLVIPTLDINKIIDHEKTKFLEKKIIVPHLTKEFAQKYPESESKNFIDIIRMYEPMHNCESIDYTSHNLYALKIEDTTKVCYDVVFNTQFLSNYNIFKIGGIHLNMVIVSQNFVDKFHSTWQYGLSFREISDTTHIPAGSSSKMTNNRS